MNTLLEEHMEFQISQLKIGMENELDDEKILEDDNYLINLGSDQITTVFASFYNILMEQIEGDKSQLFTTYMSFLIYEVKNYVGTLINSYNFIFHQDYQNNGTFYRNTLI